MQTPTYADIYIGSLDQAYIDRIAEATDVDETRAPLYSLESNKPIIANDIIYYIIYEAIQSLDISDDSKSILSDRIHINAIDSGFIDTSLDVFLKKERKVIQDFIDIF